MAMEYEPKPISRVLVVIAMQAEAMPLIDALKLKQDNGTIFPKGAPWWRYTGNLDELTVDVVVPGKCPILGVDNVGTTPLALISYAAIQALQPDLVINAGTAGGFKSKGACVGDVFQASAVAYHDRRIPIPGFDEYGVGATNLIPLTNVLNSLGFKEGRLSTGNSLDMTEKDEEIIKSNDASIKDMEGAAVVYVANLLSVPVIVLKAVTDIVDGSKPTPEEFLQNLSMSSIALLKAVVKVLNFVKGKAVDQL